MNSLDGHELTSVSFATDAPQPPERRTEERQTALLRVGKLVIEGEQRLCMIRNISRAGAMLRVYQPVAVGAQVAIEATPDCPVPGTVLWVQDDLAGIEFLQPIDVIATLRGAKTDGPYRRAARTPRLRIDCPAQLGIDAEERAVTVCDLSLNGACVATDPLLAQTAVVLRIEGLAALPARIRWCRNGHAGLEFDLPIPVAVLGAWMAERAA